MNSLVKKLASLTGIVATAGGWLQSLVLLAVRLYWGWKFLESGWGKFGRLGEVAGFFGDELGIPLPMFSAVLVATTECVGGLLLMIGLASRLAAIPLIITMIVAYVTSEREALMAISSDPDKFLSATPFQFLLASILILAFGPGVFSIDYLIKRFYLRGIRRAGGEVDS